MTMTSPYSERSMAPRPSRPGRRTGSAPARCLRRCALALGALALLPPLRLDAQQKVDVRHAVSPDVHVRLTGSVGTLRVIGWTTDSLVVTGVLPAGVKLGAYMGGDGRSPSKGAKLYLESPNDVVAGGGTLELRLPRGARLWVKSGTANVDARDVTGGLDINVIGGSVHVAGAPRELQIEAMDAAIVIDGAPAWLRAKTASGDITLHGGGTDLALTTVSGTMRVDGGTVERARLESVTGPTWFAATPAPGGALTFDSHSGAIDLLLTRRDGFTLYASSVTGAIDNQFDRTRPIAGREGRGAELNMDGGNSSARITARSFKGTISIRR
jgi:hypothetical protein